MGCKVQGVPSLQIQKDNPSLSRWTLSTYQFNRQWEFSWLAQNLTPLKYQKIHWRSVPGSVAGSLGSAVELQNRHAILVLGDLLHAPTPVPGPKLDPSLVPAAHAAARAARLQ